MWFRQPSITHHHALNVWTDINSYHHARTIFDFDKLFDEPESNGGYHHVQTSRTRIFTLPANGCTVGSKPGPIDGAPPPSTQSAGRDLTNNRDYQHHNQVSPAAGGGSQDLGRPRCLR